MMFIAGMRPDKSQFPSVHRFTTPGSSSFTKRDHAIMFGYKTYQALVIGASGGPSGSTNVSPNRDCSGGGGGSSKLVSGNLTGLATSIAVTVGAQGSSGANGNPSGAGGRGGNSTLGALATGWGGYGAYSAHTSSVANKGGEGANPDGSKGPAGGMEGVQNPSAGSWNSGTNEGSGGGGGSGSGQLAPEEAGGNGSGSSYLAPGESANGSRGGGGGGASATPLTGVAGEYYGTGNWSGKGNGAVIIKLS
jgi:hypothetical protein